MAQSLASSSPPVSPSSAGSVVRALGPASLSNLGPGFDALGACLGQMGDIVDAWRVDEPGVRLVWIEGDGGVLSTEIQSNTAGRAAQAVYAMSGATDGLHLRLHKRMAMGTGLGSSAASAVAGAWAANLALGEPFAKADLVDAVLTGEELASGARHGDNVLPALFGGVVLVSASDPTQYRRLDVPRACPVAIVLPEVQVLTKEAREILPQAVPLHRAIHNASELAFMIDALRAGDWPRVGQHMMRDQMIEPVRARLVPCYEAVKAAALAHGAFGCALSGSGPALFALAATPDEADHISGAMQAASRASGIEARAYVTDLNFDGACAL
ncbi:MAG: homoserine kinase [Bacteroidota bacterium]